MIEFHPVTSVNDAIFTQLYELYSTSFPANERRSWAGLDRELNIEKRFSANALIENKQFIGLFNYWLFDKFCYVEHLALVPQFRSQRKGSITMNMFQQKTSLPIILEVEMPNNPDAIHRIKFYENLGFKVLSHYYAQPPYEGGGFLMPMLVMSNDYHFSNTHFEMIKNTLYRDVYHFLPQMEEQNNE